MNDAFGDRMKMYEMAEAGRCVMTDRIPVIARLDGKGFSQFTDGLARPFDERLSRLMIDVTKFMVGKSGAQCGYTQSDEITLGWYEEDPKATGWFAGRIQKMVSVLAAGCSVYFNQRLPSYIPEKADIGPVFDCRVWNVPNLDEGANAFLWREYDATKNSISMAARAYYEHSEIDNKSGSEMQEMLFAKGVNWNDYPTFFKRGTYVRRRIVRTAFTAKELESLPEKHHAHKNPNAEFLRNVISTFDLPPLTKVVNRSAVLFQGAEPELAT